MIFSKGFRFLNKVFFVGFFVLQGSVLQAQQAEQQANQQVNPQVQQGAVEESEILIDLVESTSRVAYRMQVIGQYEEIQHMGEVKHSDLGNAYVFNRNLATSMFVTGAASIMGGVELLRRGIYIAGVRDRAFVSIGSGLFLSAVGFYSVVEGSTGVGGGYKDVDTADLVAIEKELFELSIREAAKTLAEQSLSIVSMDYLTNKDYLRFEKAIVAKMKDNLVKVNSSVSTFDQALDQKSEAEKAKIYKAQKQLYIKPFSVAAILFEQRLINTKQQAALEAVLEVRKLLVSDDARTPKSTGDLKKLIETQLQQSKVAMHIVQDVVAGLEEKNRKREISKELEALSAAIEESEEYLKELGEL